MRSIAAAPHIFWAILFIILPLFIVVYYAFTDSEGAFSFENVTSLSEYAQIFGLSIELAVIATFICLIIGYPLAYFMSKQSPRAQKMLMVLVMLPMWCNLLIRTYALMALLDNGGLVSSFLVSIGLPKLTFIGTDAAVILGMIYDFLAYMVLPIYTESVLFFFNGFADCNTVK